MQPSVIEASRCGFSRTADGGSPRRRRDDRQAALPRLPVPAKPNTSLYPPAERSQAEISAAPARAAKDHKRVSWSSAPNWCYDCHVLDATFHSKNFAAARERKLSRRTRQRRRRRRQKSRPGRKIRVPLKKPCASPALPSSNPTANSFTARRTANSTTASASAPPTSPPSSRSGRRPTRLAAQTSPSTIPPSRRMTAADSPRRAMPSLNFNRRVKQRPLRCGTVPTRLGGQIREQEIHARRTHRCRSVRAGGSNIRGQSGSRRRSVRADSDHFDSPGTLVLSRSVYEGKASTVTIGETLPLGCEGGLNGSTPSMCRPQRAARLERDGPLRHRDRQRRSSEPVRYT